MRKEFSILWVDESNKYSNEMMELRQKTIDNIYYLNTIEKLDEIVNLKKKNSIKLILCFENEEFGKDAINNAIAKINRPMKIIHKGKNIRINRKLFVLVFSKDQNQIDFVKPFKNVVFTNKIEDVEHFVSKDMREGFV